MPGIPGTSGGQTLATLRSLPGPSRSALHGPKTPSGILRGEATADVRCLPMVATAWLPPQTGTEAEIPYKADQGWTGVVSPRPGPPAVGWPAEVCSPETPGSPCFRRRGKMWLYSPHHRAQVPSSPGHYSDHVFACAQEPGMRRHNRLRDVWIELCRRAGWHTDAEQLVYIAQRETKRADLVTLSPDGQRLACDVMVTAAPAP